MLIFSGSFFILSLFLGFFWFVLACLIYAGKANAIRTRHSRVHNLSSTVDIEKSAHDDLYVEREKYIGNAWRSWYRCTLFFFFLTLFVLYYQSGN